MTNSVFNDPLIEVSGGEELPQINGLSQLRLQITFQEVIRNVIRVIRFLA